MIKMLAEIAALIMVTACAAILLSLILIHKLAYLLAAITLIMLMVGVSVMILYFINQERDEQEKKLREKWRQFAESILARNKAVATMCELVKEFEASGCFSKELLSGFLVLSSAARACNLVFNKSLNDLPYKDYITLQALIKAEQTFQKNFAQWQPRFAEHEGLNVIQALGAAAKGLKDSHRITVSKMENYNRAIKAYNLYLMADLKVRIFKPFLSRGNFLTFDLNKQTDSIELEEVYAGLGLREK